VIIGRKADDQLPPGGILTRFLIPVYKILEAGVIPRRVI
jgi:hypothetical protein